MNNKGTNYLDVTTTIMLLLVGLISALDLVLAVWLLDPQSSSFVVDERNPVIIQIVQLTGDFRLFIPLKIIGTLLSIFVAYKIYRGNTKLGFVITCGVFAFQVLLLFYLAFGHLSLQNIP